jgi:predicted nucleic acid-binding protein
MKKQTIYLDTSVINFLFADDSPEKKEITSDFFTNFIQTEVYDTFVSGFVIDEIENTANLTKRKNLLDIIEKYPIKFLEISESYEIQRLANAYVEKKIIPIKKFYDAYHIACAVINQINYLVSWNYRHLANVNRERLVIATNLELGYLDKFRIITPLELMDYENEYF